MNFARLFVARNRWYRFSFRATFFAEQFSRPIKRLTHYFSFFYATPTHFWTLKNTIKVSSKQTLCRKNKIYCRVFESIFWHVGIVLMIYDGQSLTSPHGPVLQVETGLQLLWLSHALRDSGFSLCTTQCVSSTTLPLTEDTQDTSRSSNPCRKWRNLSLNTISSFYYNIARFRTWPHSAEHSFHSSACHVTHIGAIHSSMWFGWFLQSALETDLPVFVFIQSMDRLLWPFPHDAEHWKKHTYVHTLYS